MMHKAITPHLNYKSAKGFTLIEVLIASFILFLVIAAITMVYRGALLSSYKAERVLTFSALIGPVSEQVRDKIHQASKETDLQGEGSMGPMLYTWSATQVKTGKAPERFDVLTGNLQTSIATFRLWDVSIDLQLKTATRQYYFNEVTW
jgi:hypothetical protein